MMQKALIKFEGKTYWLDMGTFGTGTNKFEFKILDNGKWRSVEKTEADLFAVMETGEVIGTEKPKELA